MSRGLTDELGYEKARRVVDGFLSDEAPDPAGGTNAQIARSVSGSIGVALPMEGMQDGAMLNPGRAIRLGAQLLELGLLLRDHANAVADSVMEREREIRAIYERGWQEHQRLRDATIRRALGLLADGNGRGTRREAYELLDGLLPVDAEVVEDD